MHGSNVDFGALRISSPKRRHSQLAGWSGFFPYYAGFSESFARNVLQTAQLPPNARVLDPWNGSGTTSYVAAQLGHHAVGYDINPVMVVVSKARLLDPNEADSIEPRERDILRTASRSHRGIRENDPLLAWFTAETATTIRRLERSIAHHLVGRLTITGAGTKLENVSGSAAAFYVALFATCRELIAKFQTTNPTWMKVPETDGGKLAVDEDAIHRPFVANIRKMTDALLEAKSDDELFHAVYGRSDIRLGDSLIATEAVDPADFILSSPPYCTRIDYTAATRIELAILNSLVPVDVGELARKMIGSVRVPPVALDQSEKWGETCNDFLKRLEAHPSKASRGYYKKTHIDYFTKMFRSLEKLVTRVGVGGGTVLVVQDSYYKDIHNDLPRIITEMCAEVGFSLRREEEFRLKATMAAINPHSRKYSKPRGAIEKVLCFERTV